MTWEVTSEISCLHFVPIKLVSFFGYSSLCRRLAAVARQADGDDDGGGAGGGASRADLRAKAPSVLSDK